MKKAVKIFIYVFLAAAILLIAYFVYIKYQIDRGNLVKWGGAWYTKEQLKEKFPPRYIEVPAKNTPEEVYAKFREALLKDDIESALSLIREKNREGYRDAFKNKEKLKRWIETLPEEINNLRIDGNFGYYDWDKKDGYSHTIDFMKGGDGYWKIDQI